VASALRHATLNQDLTQDLTGVYNAPEANAYPMSSYSYMITPTAGFDPAKGNVLGGWIIYIACAGQQKAASLGYSPLPPNLIKADFDAVYRIPGHPATPPIDYAHCPNPNLPHDGGGGDGNSTTPPSGGDSTTAPGDGSTSAPAAGTTVPAGTLPPGEGDTSEFGTQPLPAGVEVTTLDTAGQQAAFEAGLKNAAYAEPKPALPLVVAALSVLLVVFLPVVLEVRRSPRTTKTIQVDRPPTGPTNTGPTDAGSAGAGPEGIGDADDR
jgi:hypothetical protein